MFDGAVKYAWISVLKASSKDEGVQALISIVLPRNLDNMGHKCNFNTHPHMQCGPEANSHIACKMLL